EGWQRRMGFTPGATGSQPAGQPGGGAAVPGARVAVMLSGRQRSAELSSGGTGFQPVGQPVGGAARCGAAVRVCADAADAASARPTARDARADPDTAARRRGAAVPREVVVTVMGVSPEEGNGLEAASAVAGGSVGQSYPAGRSRHAAAMAVWSRSWKAAHGQTRWAPRTGPRPHRLRGRWRVPAPACDYAPAGAPFPTRHPHPLPNHDPDTHPPSAHP